LGAYADDSSQVSSTSAVLMVLRPVLKQVLRMVDKQVLRMVDKLAGRMEEVSPPSPGSKLWAKETSRR
jgi:hypothetical protein